LSLSPHPGEKDHGEVTQRGDIENNLRPAYNSGGLYSTVL